MQITVQPTSADISNQLNRILSFASFSNSPVLSSFLTFIVNETMEGRERTLKEYTIGTRVLAKKVNYDPQADASVRIHAGRLRRALYDYYNGPGANDKTLISVPKGSYVPRFECITASIKPAPESSKVYFKPTVAILPFHTPDDQSLYGLGDGLCDQLCTELTHFNELAVISYYSSRKIGSKTIDVGEAGLMLAAEYVLTGAIQSDSNVVRIRVQLIQTASHRQIWAATYEKDLVVMNTFVVQDDIVRHVVNQIGGSHGIIFREAIRTTAQKSVSDIKVYDAVYWYYNLNNTIGPETYKSSLSAIQKAILLDPQYALGWAILGEVYVAGFFYQYDMPVAKPLDEAVKCCREALRIDQRCDHAYQALALAYLFQHKAADSLKTIEQWVRLKSNAASIAGGLGFCLICIGQYSRGYKMLIESIELNPYHPWWFNAGLSFYHIKNGEYYDAFYWAERMQHQSEPWELILKATSFVGMGNLNDAAGCVDALCGIFPAFITIHKSYLSAFLQEPELVDHLEQSLLKAGLRAT